LLPSNFKSFSNKCLGILENPTAEPIKPPTIAAFVSVSPPYINISFIAC